VSFTRVQHFSISLDGFGTGEGQSLDAPFGHAGERLHEWLFTTRWWNEMAGQPGGTGGIDDAFVRRLDVGIGAEIMGARKFGPPGWDDDAGCRTTPSRCRRRSSIRSGPWREVVLDCWLRSE
jgi:hypothetical protein